jgi:hypothetical protein
VITNAVDVSASTDAEVNEHALSAGNPEQLRVTESPNAAPIDATDTA